MRLRSTARRRTLPTAVLGVTLLVAATTTAGVALAAERTPDGAATSAATADDSKDAPLDTSVANPDELAKQEALDAHVDPLLTSGLLESAENFGGSAVDYDDNAYDMWWRGPVPGDVRAVLDTFGDVEVRIHDARYTAREIHAAATTVSRYPADRFDVVTSTVESIDRPTPVYGIQVQVTKRVDVPDDAIAAELTRAAGLPVDVEPDLAAVPLPGSLDSAS